MDGHSRGIEFALTRPVISGADQGRLRDDAHQPPGAPDSPHPAHVLPAVLIRRLGAIGMEPVACICTCIKVLVSRMPYHETMDHGIRSDAIMLTNFDSEEQLKDWNRVREECQCTQTVESGFWLKEPGHISTCEKTLRDNPALVRRFAGIARTAFLYSPKILLTEAELFDGIFFLALGPDMILDLLGQTNRDCPAIVVSGRQRTLEQCLLHFTTDPRSEDHPETGRKGNQPDIGALRPLRYQVLNKTITAEDSKRTAPLIETTLQAEAGRDDTVAHTIARLYGAVFTGSGQGGGKSADDSFRFLGQRWQEWIDAERQGRIEYESQADRPHHSEGKSFYDSFLPISRANSDRLRQWCCGRGEDEAAADTFLKTLDNIKGENRRSQAFALIDESALPVEGQGGHDSMGCDRRTLKDWYQFVYRAAMADFLGCHLMAVQTEPNSYERYAGGNGSEASLFLSGTITRLLAEMPNPRFVGFCYDSRTAIGQWRDCNPGDPAGRQKKCIRNLAYCVQQAAHQFDRQHENMKILKQFLATLAIALVSVYFDNVILSGPIPIALILFAGWLIEVFPEMLTMLDWLRDQRSTSQTIVFGKR